MKNISFALLIALSLLSLTSCEEVIDIPLDSTDPTLVIEASLKEGTQPFNVFISYSSDYYNPELPTPVVDAEVILTDGEGQEFAVPHVNSGVYSLPFTAVAGDMYQLTVRTGGEEYQATSFLPESIEIMELIPEYQEVNPVGDPGYQVSVRFQDPGGMANFYRLRHSINGELQNGGEDMQVVNDNIFEGGEAQLPLFQQTFDSGDLVSIELIHFDEASYDYFNSLADISGGGGSGPGGATAAPGNPLSNWSGGCLGYFSASSSDTLSIRIPQ